MKVLELVNNVLALCGESPLASTTGSVGSLARNCVQTALNTVVQQTRASVFEQLVTLTGTNEDYRVPIGVLPNELIHIYSIALIDSVSNRLIPLTYKSLPTLGLNLREYTYSTIGSSVHINAAIKRPCTVQIHGLLIPTLPTADDGDLSYSSAILSAVSHIAASIFLVSYIDDPNAASIQQRMADTMLVTIRSQYGNRRGKGSMNIGHDNTSFV